MLRRFVVDICGCETLWTAAHIIDDQVARVREQVGSDEVILGLSGGVDSSVVAELLHRAIGDQLTCVFVDTGLLRWQEGDKVMATMDEHMGVRVIRVEDRKSVVEGTSVSVSVDLGGRRIINKKTKRYVKYMNGINKHNNQS